MGVWSPVDGRGLDDLCEADDTLGDDGPAGVDDGLEGVSDDLLTSGNGGAKVPRPKLS
jgi:hypothetical protein